jgi:hypothetical protein
MQLVNSLGQVVLIAPIHKQIEKVDLSAALSKGWYFIQILDAQGKVKGARKVLIQ